MTGFEPAATRPPDVYSNRAELHPEQIQLKNIIQTTGLDHPETLEPPDVYSNRSRRGEIHPEQVCKYACDF